MRFSVVINTYNRARSLRDTLDALRLQTFADFEVIVVDGPSDDGTAELLEARADAVRAVRFGERNLGMSRNLGVDAAAGDVVAFIDDDAIPEPGWLEALAAAYDDARVGGAGGVTLDATGVRMQYRYSLCDRIGRTDFDRSPPFDANVVPGANPFLYLPGGNCSFRRDVLASVEGFDEEVEYNYDDAEICVRIIDAGHPLRAVDGAVIHHRTLPSHMRGAAGFTDPFYAIKNRTYFALRVGRGYHPRAEAIAALAEHLRELRTRARRALAPSELERFEARLDEGFAVGMERGLAGVRRGRPIQPPDVGAFLPYPVLAATGRRQTVCFVSPPDRAAARDLAAAGHEAHVVTPDDDGPYRIELEDGVWVHRFPVAARHIPELAGHPLKADLDRLAALQGAVARLVGRNPARDVRIVRDPPGGPLEQALLGSDQGAVAQLLARECALDPAAADAAAAALLDPSRFPYDCEPGLREAFDVVGDEEFVDRVFRTVLRRPPDADGGASYRHRLAQGEPRPAIAAEIVRSEEARVDLVDPAVVERLPEHDVRELVAAGYADDDRVFAAALERLAGPGDWAAQLAGGASRAEVVRAALNTPGTRERIIGLDRLDPETIVPARQVLEELGARWRDHQGFVEAAYRLLLGRAADEGGARRYRRLLDAGVPHATVVHALASSAEAGERGVPGQLADALATALTHRRPWHRLTRRGAPRLSAVRSTADIA